MEEELTASGRASVCVATVFHADVAFTAAPGRCHAWFLVAVARIIIHIIWQRQFAYGLRYTAGFCLVAYGILVVVQVLIFLFSHRSIG